MVKCSSQKELLNPNQFIFYNLFSENDFMSIFLMHLLTSLFFYPFLKSSQRSVFYDLLLLTSLWRTHTFKTFWSAHRNELVCVQKPDLGLTSAVRITLGSIKDVFRVKICVSLSDQSLSNSCKNILKT